MKVPPNTHEYCSRTNPQKISCQNDTRLYDKGTKSERQSRARRAYVSGCSASRGRPRRTRFNKFSILPVTAEETSASK
jgi:hypothetical protein